jgi:hypothetical protein
MRSTSTKLLAVFAMAVLLTIQAKSQTHEKKDQAARKPLPDSLFFNALITQYINSINEADTDLASKIWAPTTEVSFINPGGTEYGWDGIKNIYKMFRENFSARKLAFYNLKYSYYGDVSWVTFYWIFDATLKPNNNVVQTKGRETQIWRKLNSEWRLVHVHYSEVPAAGQGI